MADESFLEKCQKNMLKGKRANENRMKMIIVLKHHNVKSMKVSSCELKFMICVEGRWKLLLQGYVRGC